MRAYSLDLRKEIVEAVKRGVPKAEAARTFGVGISSVKRYVKMVEESCSLAPKKAPGKRKKLDERGMRLLEEDLESRPAVKLKERVEFLFWVLGVRVSEATVCRMIRCLGYTRKKIDGCQRGARVAEASLANGTLEGRREAASVCGRVRDQYLAGTPLRLRAQRLQSPQQGAPQSRKNTTLIASMTLSGMGEAVAFEGATDAPTFEAYVERFLAPTLKERQIVVMDKLGAHRGEKVRELIEARGAHLWFLPSYSPDLNPIIEEAFSKIKALLKKKAARTKEALLEAIAEALRAVTPKDAEGWFAHCGYDTEAQYL